MRELESRERGRIIGVSRSWKETLRSVGRVASSETSVLITGESGTGKEVVANLIHQGSPRAGKPFVAINCAALPEQFLESELFRTRARRLHRCHRDEDRAHRAGSRGTLFLDEITEMSPVVQAKLLRVLQEREFQRVGGTRTIRADIRVIAATNRDLLGSIERQTFREDLYYRLNVFQIPITAPGTGSRTSCRWRRRSWKTWAARWVVPPPGSRATLAAGCSNTRGPATCARRGTRSSGRSCCATAA